MREIGLYLQHLHIGTRFGKNERYFVLNINSVPLLQHSMGQVTKSLASVCVSVSVSVVTPTAAIFIQFPGNFAQWLGA